MTEPLIALDDASVAFEKKKLMGLAGSQTVRAVDGVSLDIHENDVVALVGESGCGKTTLGKTAIGLQRPTGGAVRYRGQDVWATKDATGRFGTKFEGDYEYSEIRRALQIIHQDPGSSLNSNYTVESALADPLKIWHKDLDADDRRARILGLLEYVGMTPPEDYAGRYPHQLSGGEQQRVALIRALLMNPDLILADEAISALDVSLRVEMMDLMLELQDQFNTSYLFISHDLSNARYLATKADGRIGIMYLGELVEIGTVEQIFNNPQHPYTKVLLWATPDLENEDVTEPPIREIDVPDPADPPSGCRFHTRCPEAREVCTTDHPTSFDIPNDEAHRAACFRADDSHYYWESVSVVESEEVDMRSDTGQRSEGD
jgi:peptide/nickel transport system ATP-binding protein